VFGKEAISEAQLKKMKIKDLKAFLESRGMDCVGCAEKSDFVRRALQVKDRPVVNEALKPVEVKSDPIWEQWRDKAKEICEKHCPASLQTQGYCKQLMLVVETVVEKYAKRFHKQLSVTPIQLTKYSMSHPYKIAGETLIRRTLNMMVKQETKAVAKIEKHLEEPLNFWLRDCALQNINTMNDILAQPPDEL